MYNEGISLAGDLLDIGTEYGAIKKAGNSYSFGEEKLGVGRENAKKVMRGDKNLMKKIKDKILELYNNKQKEE
jgi:recombination protein RecA